MTQRRLVLGAHAVVTCARGPSPSRLTRRAGASPSAYGRAVDDPEVRAIARADELAAKVSGLVPDAVVVEVRRDTRWWVQLNWTGPRDDAAAARVVETLEGAGLVLVPRVPGPAGDVVDRVAGGELLEVAER